ncbi:MAG: flagellar motor protein MotB [Oscillospiraceae bacterium]|jgi:chemotaxis protein MotB|nr:flagellar motor protein MotB [Oscillospiraceae bacterium]
MARKKKEFPQAPGCAAWLATYGDMITLVLTFFVLLFSMSSIDIEKWKMMVMNLTGSNSIFDAMDFTTNWDSTGLEEAPDIPDDMFVDPSDEWAMMASEIQDIIDQWLAGRYDNDASESSAEQNVVVDITVTQAQITIRCQGEILFDTLSDVIKPEGYEVLDFIIGDLIMPRWDTGIISEVNIEGHADIRPIQRNLSRFPTNKHLSAARAISAWEYMTTNYDVPDGKVGAVGYGEYRPVDGDFGTSEEQWSRNRRVEFVMHRNFDLDEQTGQGYMPAAS